MMKSSINWIKKHFSKNEYKHENIQNKLKYYLTVK